MKTLNDFDIQIGNGKDIEYEKEVLKEMLSMGGRGQGNSLC